jgi:hypothetical protein
METSEHTAQVYRDGRPIAESAILMRSFEARVVEMPLAGRQDVGYKDVSVTGPTRIRIEGPTPTFTAELERLLAGAQDVEIGRRDRQWRPEPIDVVVEGETLSGCILDRPTNYFGSIEAVEFGLHHEQL